MRLKNEQYLESAPPMFSLGKYVGLRDLDVKGWCRILKVRQSIRRLVMAEHAVFFGEDGSVIIDRNKISELILDDPLWQGRAIPHTPPASPKNTVHSLRYFDIDYEKRCIDDYYESPMDFIHGAQEKVETEFGMTLQGWDTELVWAGSEAWAKVDLLASREQLLADFKLWLDSMALPTSPHFE